jgi:hypothetical protein
MFFWGIVTLILLNYDNTMYVLKAMFTLKIINNLIYRNVTIPQESLPHCLSTQEMSKVPTMEILSNTE